MILNTYSPEKPPSVTRRLEFSIRGITASKHLRAGSSSSSFTCQISALSNHAVPNLVLIRLVKAAICSEAYYFIKPFSKELITGNSLVSKVNSALGTSKKEKSLGIREIVWDSRETEPI